MKKINFLLVVLVVVLAFSSCNKSETYADQLERENDAIHAFIVKKGINVITEAQFTKQGNTTDTTKNQYVLFPNTGVYMQIVEKGTGEVIKKGETATVLCRFTERNLLRDTVQLSNQYLVFGPKVDKMSVTNTSGTYTASFDPLSSVMYEVYQSTSVPNGWLVPMPYIGLGRLVRADSKLSHVRLIVPSQQGQINASQSVYPCFYDLTFQRGL
jgi:putative lipoprotein